MSDRFAGASERRWKRLALECMRFLTREQIETATRAAGASATFCADGERRPSDSERMDYLETRLNKPLEPVVAPRSDGNGDFVIELRVGLRDRWRDTEQWPQPWTLREAIDAAAADPETR